MRKREIALGEDYAVAPAAGNLSLIARRATVIELTAPADPHSRAPKVMMRLPLAFDHPDVLVERAVFCADVLMPWAEYERAREAEIAAYHRELADGERLIELLRAAGVKSAHLDAGRVRWRVTRPHAAMLEPDLAKLVARSTWDGAAGYLASSAQLASEDLSAGSLPDAYRDHQLQIAQLKAHLTMRALKMTRPRGARRARVTLGIDDLGKVLLSTDLQPRSAQRSAGQALKVRLAGGR